MIAIENVLISDEVVQEQFVCDLQKCKGGCCVDGDAGAPLEKQELAFIQEVYEQVKPYLPESSVKEIERQGLYVYDKEFGWVTPTVNSQICVYGITNEQGIVHCGIEQAYNDGKVTWKKPLSCHLFPIKVSKSSDKTLDLVNYEPREDLCAAACTLGKKLKVPTYVFLKEALIRKFGTEFYEALDAVANNYKEYFKEENK